MTAPALLLLELVALFFGVAFAIQLLQRRLGDERLRAWMGGPPPVAALKGIAIGFITPFCTYSAIPLLVGFRQAGVPAAGYVAFIVAAPVLDPILFGALVLIVGLTAAVTYLLVAFTAAFTLALAAERINITRWLKPLPASLLSTLECSSEDTPTLDDPESCDAPPAPPWRGLTTEAPHAARAAATLLRSMAPLLLLGVAIGLAITELLPVSTAARITGVSDTFAIPVAAALGTPMYVNTGLFVPIADSLGTAGVSTGAIIALTIAGAGANVPEFVILGRLAQLRLVGAFFAYVFLIAIAGGLLAEAIVT
ncbi:MAG: hypothetical protein HOH95_13730 [Dehalococcoidia bacterium]|jgi:uncharacterized protein|nr:hypothetical protein [Dehalococcoidia bacterium]